MAHLEAAQRSPHTLRMLRHCTGQTLRWLGETQSVTGPDQLSRDHLELWTRHVLVRRTGKGLPLAQNTLIKQFECDRSFLDWLEKEGAVPAGFSNLIPTIKPDDLLPRSVLTHPEMVMLLESIDVTTHDGFQLRAMCEFFYTTGVRATELLDLDIHSFDLDACSVRVMGKGRKERVVPFGETAQKYLINYLSAIRPQRLRDPHETALWLDRMGERLPYYTLRRWLITAVDRLQLSEKVRMHTFRRSCATVLLRGGAPRPRR